MAASLSVSSVQVQAVRACDDCYYSSVDVDEHSVSQHRAWDSRCYAMPGDTVGELWSSRRGMPALQYECVECCAVWSILCEKVSLVRV